MSRYGLVMGAPLQGNQASGSSPVLWTPASLPSAPFIWLNDDSAVTDAGSGACSQWNDISGNGYNVTQTTGAERPTIEANALNSRRGMGFDGGDDLNIPSGALSFAQNQSSAWCFCLYRHDVTDAVDTDRILISFATNTTSARFALFAGSAVSGGKNKCTIGGRRLDGDSFFSAVSPTERVGSYTMALGVADYANRTLTLYVNGAQDAQTTNAWSAGGNSSNTASVRARVGAGIGVSPTGFVNGKMPEVFAGRAIPSGADIDRIFGYAAWRWSLQGSLSSNHPYKNFPPLA